MAHPPHVKAAVIASLMVGDSVTEVAREHGIPKQTVSRWKPEANAYLREIVRSSPELQELARTIRQVLPGLSRKNGTKKRGFSDAVKKEYKAGHRQLCST